MILRRVTQHVREQNWTAIGVDFAIVVLGVFLGIQLGNWNAARVNAENERAMLLRLQEEFLSVEEELARISDNYVLTVRSTGHIIETLRSETPPTDDAAFKDALRAAQYVWGTPALSATYSEMVSTGALSRLSDPELRGALTRYGDYAAKYERALPEALAVVLDPSSNYLQAVAWNVDPTEWSTANAIVSYDWDRLLGSQAELQSWLAYQDDLRAFSQGQLEEVEKVLALLEASP